MRPRPALAPAARALLAALTLVLAAALAAPAGACSRILQEGVSPQLVAGLDALGVPPRDLIGILQAIDAAGALQAEIVVM